jgi:hypothetical protein
VITRLTHTGDDLMRFVVVSGTGQMFFVRYFKNALGEASGEPSYRYEIFPAQLKSRDEREACIQYAKHLCSHRKTFSDQNRAEEMLVQTLVRLQDEPHSVVSEPKFDEAAVKAQGDEAYRTVRIPAEEFADSLGQIRAIHESIDNSVGAEEI